MQYFLNVIYFLAWLSLVLFLGVSSLMMSKLLFLLSILRVTFENSVGLDIITGCLSFNFFILRLWLLFFVVELRFGAVEGFLWFVFVSVAGMVVPKAVVVVSPELTLTLILVSKASTSCPDYWKEYFPNLLESALLPQFFVYLARDFNFWLLADF